MENSIVLELPHRPGNPRNSEGAFITLTDGRIMFAWSRYEGEDWEDHAPAVIAARCSSDGGATWEAGERVLVAREGRCNVMSVSLLRLQDGRLALWYLRKNSLQDCRPWLRTSADEGATWSEPICCIPAPGYFVVNNDRVIQLSSGRILVPAGYHRAKLDTDEMDYTRGFDGRAVDLFYYSDDGGASWQEAPDWIVLPRRSGSGLQEPGLIELTDERIYGWARTDLGRQYEFSSRDGGLHWSQARPSAFRSPCSPMSIKRIPASGDLLAVWNDAGAGIVPEPSSWGRTPLAASVSRDDGRSWSTPRLLEDDPARGYCYTAIHFAGDHVLLAYLCGGRGGGVLQDLRLRRVALGWFYGE
ncbi:MAG: sialidase family protein [Anaerolineae bacterium]